MGAISLGFRACRLNRGEEGVDEPGFVPDLTVIAEVAKVLKLTGRDRDDRHAA
jgi:hypothetical protein